MEKMHPSQVGAACYDFADGGRAVPDLLSWQEFSLFGAAQIHVTSTGPELLT